MDLERVKQLRNEYAEYAEYAGQHIISMEQFEKFQENLYSQEAVVPEPTQAPQPSSTFDYAQMTRQQRRAYERRLAKENKRKY